MKSSTDTFPASIFPVLTVCWECNSSGNKVLDVIAQWTGWTLWRGKYKGDAIKHSVCRSTLRVGILPGKKNIPDAFHPGADSDCRLFVKPDTWAPGWPCQHPPCSCTRRALFFPLSAQLKRAGRERRGIRDASGTRALLQTGGLYSKGVCKNRTRLDDSKQPGGKTKYANDICRERLGKKIISGWVM